MTEIILMIFEEFVLVDSVIRKKPKTAHPSNIAVALLGLSELFG